MGKVILWLLRKALYVAAGTVLARLVAEYGLHQNFDGATIAAVVTGLLTAVVGDVRRALAPDFLQVASGEDPRVDG